ncbi:MAG: poly-beta-hydroxybutyrate polymerase, partial [bacterium]|nr:poly-beta-hydroxybutyrate polymerase [bacterium]
AAYRTATLLGGHNRFVLSTSGHIAGIVNPPSPKARHWTNDQIPESPEGWLEDAEQHQQTWWEDWATWIGQRAGGRVDAPKQLGSEAYTPMEDAPGLYVKMRSDGAFSD